MTVWYTSDLHLGHGIVAGHRGAFKYRNPDEPDLGLIGDPDLFYERLFVVWNRVVAPDDEVWILGDLTLASTRMKLQNVMMQVQALNGRKHLISGNHDVIHPMHPGANTWILEYSKAFESVQPYAQQLIQGRKVLLSHFPYSPIDRDYNREDRLRPWRPVNTGTFLLHGHTHTNRILTSGTKMIHVGWDAWKRPVSREEIIKVMIQIEQNREAS